MTWRRRIRAAVDDPVRRPRVLAIGAAALWVLVLIAIWLLGNPSRAPLGGMDLLLRWLGVLGPFALIALAGWLAGELAQLRLEALRLRALLDANRPEGKADPATEPFQRPSATAANAPAPTHPAASLRSRQTQLEATPVARDTRQVAMSLDAPNAAPVAAGTLARALHFPDGPEDREGIEALRASLRDPGHARLIRAAQDVVTLLAGRGIYMDDIIPKPAAAPAWRAYISGDATGSIDLASFEDESSVEIIEAAMRADEIFRDAAHHFLRQFDATLERLAAHVDDEVLMSLLDSRSGRAFRILGRVAGGFA